MGRRRLRRRRYATVVDGGADDDHHAGVLGRAKDRCNIDRRKYRDARLSTRSIVPTLYVPQSTYYCFTERQLVCKVAYPRR